VPKRTYQPKKPPLCAGTASCTGTAPVTPRGPQGAFLRGGGSPSERAARRSSAPLNGGQAAVRKQLRLRRRKDFDVVFQEGQVPNRLVLRSVPNQLPHNRYGFVTSKRVGKAVVRNRVRRRLREAIRSPPFGPAGMSSSRPGSPPTRTSTS
jgi:hypothetical protein